MIVSKTSSFSGKEKPRIPANIPENNVRKLSLIREDWNVLQNTSKRKMNELLFLAPFFFQQQISANEKCDLISM